MTGEPSRGHHEERLGAVARNDRARPQPPCIFSWGVCNEIGGQNPPAYAFARRMYEEAKASIPSAWCPTPRTRSRRRPDKDVAGLMDYIMWNEYVGSWYAGTPEDLARNLDEIHRAFPGKPVVISEYGYCACTADRPEGDSRASRVLQRARRGVSQARLSWRD